MPARNGPNGARRSEPPIVLAMKIALVILPKDSDCDLVTNGSVAPRVLMLGRAKVLGVLASLFACAVLLVITTFLVSRETLAGSAVVREAPAAANTDASPATVATPPIAQHRAVVRPIENPVSLRRGDTVVLRSKASAGPAVRKVAGAPRETVVIRRGGEVDGLYLLGANSYVVTADSAPARVIRPDEIVGTLEDSN
jgi:hypothetical protein